MNYFDILSPTNRKFKTESCTQKKISFTFIPWAERQKCYVGLLLLTVFLSCDSCIMNSCLYQYHIRREKSLKKGFPPSSLHIIVWFNIVYWKIVGLVAIIMADIVWQNKIYFIRKSCSFIFPKMFITKCKRRFPEPYCHYFISHPTSIVSIHGILKQLVVSS